MKNAVIVDCVRTPMGRSKQGVFRNIRSEDLSSEVMQHLVNRNQIDPVIIEDIIWGCVMQTKEQGFNIARNAALLADLPKSIGAVTVNRLCGSSMQAIHDAAKAIMTNNGDVFLAGGVEHMGHIPMTHGVDFHPSLALNTAMGSGSMGLTAELLAKVNGISRVMQDEFAMRSHQNAYSAASNGLFDNQMISVMGHDSDGGLAKISSDEVIRPDTNLDSLSKLPTVFDPKNGTVTAGSSSALSDGASALLIMSEEKAKQLGLKIRARILSMAVSGCDPATMGIGPVPASIKALQRAGLDLCDIDIIELNEAFSAQALSVLKELNLLDSYQDKVNLSGGAIALGHPLGCSGARITTSLVNLLEQQDKEFGLATMCIGLGQGIATVIERCN